MIAQKNIPVPPPPPPSRTHGNHNAELVLMKFEQKSKFAAKAT